MGLVASLTTRAPAAGYRFQWASAQPLTYRLEVRRHGKRLASGTFRRSIPGVVNERPVTDAGFYGSYYTRADVAKRGPAILLLGGSEGGLPSGRLLTMLAARGFPTLSLAYFRAPGLPQTLANIPLEYFEKALTWLRAQPEVDPNRIAVIGVSYGSQLHSSLEFTTQASSAQSSHQFPATSRPAGSRGAQGRRGHPGDSRCHTRKSSTIHIPPITRTLSFKTSAFVDRSSSFAAATTWSGFLVRTRGRS